jgi:hypothetical protein
VLVLVLTFNLRGDMKIAVIGAGTASCIFNMVACRMINKPVEITCIHDPSVPTIEVGETASPAILETLQNCLDFKVEDDLNELDGTLRTGVKHFWADASNDFFIDYDRQFGIHINSTKLSGFVLARLKKLYPFFKEQHDTVTKVNKVTGEVTTKTGTEQYDLVVDCTGFANPALFETGEIVKAKFAAVNSVIIWPEWEHYFEYYTTAKVHNNGWMFGVPLTKRKAWGYLYNNELTTYEEAKQEFKQIKNLDDETVNKCRSFSWHQYYRVKAIDHKVLYLGNNLFFFEPSGAQPLHYYLNISRIIAEDIGTHPFDARYQKMINDYHVQMMGQLQDVTAITYAGENRLESNYWKETKEQAINTLKNSVDWRRWLNNDLGVDHYFTMPKELMAQYIFKFGLDLSQFR